MRGEICKVGSLGHVTMASKIFHQNGGARLKSPPQSRPCSQAIYSIINYLLTESEVMPGKYQTEALTYRPSDSEVDTPKPKFDISRHYRTVEVSKLFIIWHFSLLSFCKRKEMLIVNRKHVFFFSSQDFSRHNVFQVLRGNQLLANFKLQ